MLGDLARTNDTRPGVSLSHNPGSYAAGGRYGSVADLLRQIRHDERIHKLDKVPNMRASRFGPGG
jgi:ubiquinol oxidase